MKTNVIDRIRDRSLDFSLRELGGRVEPPDLADEIVRRRRVEGVAGRDPVRDRNRQDSDGDLSGSLNRRTSPWLAAALVILAVGVTTWVSAAGQLPLLTGPVVIFVDGDQLLAFDMRSGKEHWRIGVPKSEYGTPVVHDGIAYVGSREGHLIAVNVARGVVAWRRQIGGGGYVMDGRTRIALREGRMFCVLEKTTKDGTLGRFINTDATTGGTLWKFDTDAAILGYDLSEDHSFAVCSDGKLYAIDLEKGAETWVRDLRDPNVETDYKRGEVHGPVVCDGFVLVSVGQTLFAGGAGDGEVKWKFGGRSPLGKPTLAGNRVVVGGAHLSAMTITEGRRMWMNTGLNPSATLAVSGEHLLAADSAPDKKGFGRLSMYLWKNGMARWTRMLESGTPRALATLDGFVCVLSAKRLQVIRVEDSRPEWLVDLKGTVSGVCAVMLEEIESRGPKEKSAEKKKPVKKDK